MLKSSTLLGVLAASIFTAGSLQARTIMSVAFGTITGVSQQQRDTSGGSTGGAIVGGLAGLATGRGRSGSNRALRTLGGAAVGSAVGRAGASGIENVFTVSLIDGGTVRVIMDSGNYRMGDCVAVEQGGSTNNMRRVSNEFCINNARVPAQYKAEARRKAEQCAQATQRLLDAQTDEEVRTAQTVMNILCEG